MQYLPVCLNVRDTAVAIIGGGQVATRKARLLVRAGARITVVSPQIEAELQQLLDNNAGEWINTHFEPAHLQKQALVIAATPTAAVNEQVYHSAVALGLPINVVDQPDFCTFIFPAIVDRDPLLIAISSSGQSPVLTRILRRQIEALLPAAFGHLAQFAGRLRKKVSEALPNDSTRRQFWERVLEGDIAQAVLAGREAEAEALLLGRLEGTASETLGDVALVGAGPGDPDLLTLKALRLLQSADVVLYDRLVSDAIVDLARRDAQRIYVGKRRADHTLPQTEINALLVQLASEGKRVVRLKGGDPFIFGRGGEEIELLSQHQIPFQVVPGVTAANGASCYAGIPLTHRDYAQSVRFVAGYLKGDSVEHDWAQFQSSTETLVFYMGLMGLNQICSGLQKFGRAADTPVALVEQGTAAQQRVLIGTLESMPDIIEREKPAAPTLIIVGDVVRLHDELAWFGEVKPTTGR